MKTTRFYFYFPEGSNQAVNVLKCRKYFCLDNLIFLRGIMRKSLYPLDGTDCPHIMTFKSFTFIETAISLKYNNLCKMSYAFLFLKSIL
jgi:hypothetical protein